jgi:hypothetical protein
MKFRILVVNHLESILALSSEAFCSASARRAILSKDACSEVSTSTLPGVHGLMLFFGSALSMHLLKKKFDESI